MVRRSFRSFPSTYGIDDLNGEPTAGSFYEKELQKTSQEKFRIEKVLKRKGDKLSVRLIKKTFNETFKWNFINESFKCNLLNEIF